MYSILLSKIDVSFNIIKDEVKKLVHENMRVAILPWTFPFEIDSNQLVNEYFKENDKRYNKYVNPLIDLGIKKEAITICDCYKHSKEELKKIINNSDILVLPGGNPEMFFSKVVHETELLYNIKYFKGLIIGESAGCELHLKRYFITEKNNYYDYFAFYDGFGIIDDTFYMDVHSMDDLDYSKKLQEIANEKKRIVYAIFDDGAIIYNRDVKECKLFGRVDKYLPLY